MTLATFTSPTTAEESAKALAASLKTLGHNAVAFRVPGNAWRVRIFGS